MVSFYYTFVRETVADGNGHGGFNDTSAGSGVDGAGGLIFRYVLRYAVFYQPSEN